MVSIDLRGQTAVVTGGLQGIGRSIAELLHQAGACVVVGDIAITASETGDRWLWLSFDISRPEQAGELIAVMKPRRYGRIINIASQAGKKLSPDWVVYRLKACGTRLTNYLC